jgi:hypothetical protein
VDDLTVDAYSPLAHKAIITGTGPGWRPYTWVPDIERRRLAAYTLRAAYLRNTARLFATPTEKGVPIDARREYGDVDLAVARIAAGVLGDDWSLVVDGADDELGDGPDLPDKPESPGPDASEWEQRAFTAQLERWNVDSERIVTDWLDQFTSQPARQAHQDVVREWADRRQLAARLVEATTDAVSLGDSVLVMWPQDNDWPRVEVFDPGLYFPVLPDDGTIVDFPDKVHLAWEFDHTEGGETRRYLRRLTWELRPLVANPDDPESPEATVAMPWHGDDDQPATHTCVFSDGTWPLASVRADSTNVLDDLSDNAATWSTQELDLGIDFLPVIHLPGTPEGKQHYGRSVIDSVAQLLDDVSLTDTDTATAARYLSDPVVALSGASTAENQVGPGRIYNVGPDGRMTVLDLSAGLGKLMERDDQLRDLFWQNIRVPGVLVGRANMSQSSGVAIALSYAPFSQLVAVIRLALEPKANLLPKFAARLAQIAGALDAGPLPDTRIEFGNYLPTDKAEIVAAVTSALAAHAISTQTAVVMLVEAGFPIESAADEVQRIRYENPAAANELATATASEQAAADWLGIQVDTAPAGPAVAPPTINLPPVPDAGPVPPVPPVPPGQ